jgi:hypothetical protein
MSVSSGPEVSNDGLISLIDPYNIICTRGIGTNSPSFNPFRDVLGNISYSATDGLYLTNKTYFTCVGLTYPESSQVFPWTNRQGITPGINDTSTSKLYDHSRDLGYFAFDENSNTWVADSYFTGERINGHCYDTYDGEPAQHAAFQADYDRIKKSFPHATHIVIGSHAAENNDDNAQTVLRLKEIGLPDSHIEAGGRPEYILIGKPNDKLTHSYVRENINSDVGILNIALPLKSNIQNSFYLNGSVNLIGADSALIDIEGNKTLSCWVKMSSAASCGIAVKGTSAAYGMGLGYGWSGGGFMALAWNSANAPALTQDANRDVGKWCFLNAVQDGSTRYIYVWDSLGVRVSSYSGGTHSWNNSSALGIGSTGDSSSRVPSGTEIGQVAIYNRALTSDEIQQNFQALRSRYGI